jgi:PAS domain S-box-containing protein
VRSTWRLLVIGPETPRLVELRAGLRALNAEVVESPSVEAALPRLLLGGFQVVLLEEESADQGLTDAVVKLRRAMRDGPVVVLGHPGDPSGPIQALRSWASDFLPLPAPEPELRACLERSARLKPPCDDLHERDQALLHLLDLVEVVVLIMRTDLTVAYISPFALRFLGFSHDEVIGTNALDVFRPLRDPGVTDEAVQKLLNRELVRGLQEQITLRDGTLRWIIWNACLLEDYEGAPGFLAVAHDISEVKALQDRAVQTERLAAIGQMMAGLAHESRNALQRSQACLEMLALECRENDKALSLIDRLQVAQTHLTTLYEDVRSYASPLRLERLRVPLDEIWRRSWHHFVTERSFHDATLQEHLDATDLQCQVDAFRLGQVFDNIFENALAATPAPARVELQAEPAMLNQREAIRIRVRDHGPGLSPEAQARIFDPFFTTKTKGTGLGMAIARRIVEAHGGEITAGNPAGTGTEILLTLPREMP